MELKYKVWIEMRKLSPHAWNVDHLIPAVSSFGIVLDHTPMSGVQSLEKMMVAMAVADLKQVPKGIMLWVRGMSRILEVIVHGWIEEPLPIIAPVDPTPDQAFFDEVQEQRLLPPAIQPTVDTATVTVAFETMYSLWERLKPGKERDEIEKAIGASPFFRRRTVATRAAAPTDGEENSKNEAPKVAPKEAGESNSNADGWILVQDEGGHEIEDLSSPTAPNIPLQKVNDSNPPSVLVGGTGSAVDIHQTLLDFIEKGKKVRENQENQVMVGDTSKNQETIIPTGEISAGKKGQGKLSWADICDEEDRAEAVQYQAVPISPFKEDYVRSHIPNHPEPENPCQRPWIFAGPNPKPHGPVPIKNLITNPTIPLYPPPPEQADLQPINSPPITASDPNHTQPVINLAAAAEQVVLPKCKKRKGKAPAQSQEKGSKPVDGKLRQSAHLSGRRPQTKFFPRATKPKQAIGAAAKSNLSARLETADITAALEAEQLTQVPLTQQKCDRVDAFCGIGMPILADDSAGTELAIGDLVVCSQKPPQETAVPENQNVVLPQESQGDNANELYEESLLPSIESEPEELSEGEFSDA